MKGLSCYLPRGNDRESVPLCAGIGSFAQKTRRVSVSRYDGWHVLSIPFSPSSIVGR